MRLLRELPAEPGSLKKLGVFICGACGHEVVAQLSYGKAKTYCSRECKIDAEATMWGPGRVDTYALAEYPGSKTGVPEYDYDGELIEKPSRGPGYFNYRGDKEKDTIKSPKATRRAS